MAEASRRETTVRDGVAAGLATAAPAMVFIVPFGLYSGVVAAESGLDLSGLLALSILVFAGASQLAALELMRAGAPWFVIAASGVAVNLRFLTYSAAVAPYFRDASRPTRALVSYFVVDNVVGTFLAWRRMRGSGVAPRVAFFVAAGGASWLAWQISAVAAHQLGAAALGGALDGSVLDLVAPLAVLAMATPLLTSAPRWAAATVAASAAVALDGMPYELHVMIAAALGVAVGLLFPAPEDDAEAEAPPAAASRQTTEEGA